MCGRSGVYNNGSGRAEAEFITTEPSETFLCELVVVQTTPGGGVSILGVGKITGPHQGPEKEACEVSKRSCTKWFLLSFSVPF
jgi:hypothetical protein